MSADPHFENLPETVKNAVSFGILVSVYYDLGHAKSNPDTIYIDSNLDGATVMSCSLWRPRPPQSALWNVPVTSAWLAWFWKAGSFYKCKLNTNATMNCIWTGVAIKTWNAYITAGCFSITKSTVCLIHAWARHLNTSAKNLRCEASIGCFVLKCLFRRALKSECFSSLQVRTTLEMSIVGGPTSSRQNGNIKVTQAVMHGCISQLEKTWLK